jgi:hypothetical protein
MVSTQKLIQALQKILNNPDNDKTVFELLSDRKFLLSHSAIEFTLTEVLGRFPTRTEVLSVRPDYIPNEKRPAL